VALDEELRERVLIAALVREHGGVRREALQEVDTVFAERRETDSRRRRSPGSSASPCGPAARDRRRGGRRRGSRRASCPSRPRADGAQRAPAGSAVS
jgi:hypothetical protein